MKLVILIGFDVGVMLMLCEVFVWIVSGSRIRNIGVSSFSEEDVLPRKASRAYVTYYTHPIS
jgi:hypothetical protein